MSLSLASASPVSLGLAALAVGAYVVAALPLGARSRAAAAALVVGMLAHISWLAFDIGSVGLSGRAVRLGFGPVLSLTVCLVLAVHAVESRFVPVPAVRRILAVAGLAAVLVSLAFPGELRVLGSRWAPVHWLLGVTAYALFGAAVLHGLLLDETERRLRQRGVAGAPPKASLGAAMGSGLGMPLLQLERLTFLFVQAGFAVLTAAIALGVATAAGWRLDHKTVLSVVAWAVFATLLVGRHWRGWRGRRATRWLYAGTLVLLLAYVGTRFVSEVVLGR